MPNKVAYANLRKDAKPDLAVIKRSLARDIIYDMSDEEFDRVFKYSKEATMEEDIERHIVTINL